MPRPGPPTPIGVVGHVEWVTHALGTPPERGHISDLRDPLREPAGGGCVAAAAVARTGRPVAFFTALGDDDTARASREELQRRSVEVHAVARSGPQTPVLSIAEPDGERTIMVIGERLQPAGGDPLPWHLLSQCGACYYAGEDPDSLVHARRATVLVATARRAQDLLAADVRADVVVASAGDPLEDPSVLPARLRPEWTVVTDGPRGGRITRADGTSGRYDAVPPPAPVVDTYGCGDTFAACLAAAMGEGAGVQEAATAAAAEAARCATWRGGLGPRS